MGRSHIAVSLSVFPPFPFTLSLKKKQAARPLPLGSIDHSARSVGEAEDVAVTSLTGHSPLNPGPRATAARL